MAHKHEIIVIGASSGGVETLCELMRSLPSDLGAAVLVVLHIGSASALPQILERCGHIKVAHATDGEPLHPCRAYVAPPGHHMVVRDARIELTRGPYENRHRPAIDPLFRSAARLYREHVAGVILSGALDDGAAGLHAIKSRGGVAIVQDPASALVPAMPRAALQHVKVDYCLPVDKIGARLVKLAGRVRGARKLGLLHPPPPSPEASETGATEGVRGEQVPFACPECHGPMYEVKKGRLHYFHCHVGHSFGPENLTAAHSEALERAIWIALRTLRERTHIQRTLARNAEGPDERQLAARFEENAASAESDAALLQEILERI